MFLFKGILISVKPVSGRVPVNRCPTIKLPQFFSRRIKVKEHWKTFCRAHECAGKRSGFFISAETAGEVEFPSLLVKVRHSLECLQQNVLSLVVPLILDTVSDKSSNLQNDLFFS